MYRYRYDAQNRLTKAYSSRDSLVWTMEASYSYYLHGPLARMELGHSKVQGIDYGYTLQGWLKGVNATVPSADMGGDGYHGSSVGRDALGFALQYNMEDYKPVQAVKQPFAQLAGVNLFNGNISVMTLNNPVLGAPLAYTYFYDQLNRLAAKKTWTGLDTTLNLWTRRAVSTAYQEYINYDANGNIISNRRDGHKGEMDIMVYDYKPGTNRLRHVRDAIPANRYSTDMDNQLTDNYSYDAIGNLIADKSERIDTISWTVYGKIAGIKKRNGTIRYKYDAAGNRVYKQSVLDGKTNTSFYVRDAQGNVLGVYDLNENGLSWEEQHLYGSSRLGVYRYGATLPLQPVTTRSASAVLQDSMAWGSRVYELSNHLGNVLATVSDKKLQVAGTGNTVAYYRAETLSANDYFAFGSLIEDRSFSVGNGYRYGFNGKENDNEIAGTGNSIHFEFREYDPRLGRMKSLDPRSSDYAWQSPYAYHRNSPVNMIDYMGLGDPPTKAYHNTSAESGAKILKEGFKSGKSGWNFFMTNSSGKAAGSEVSNAPVQIETAINTEGAKTISYKQWSGFFDEAKGQLGYGEIENSQLTKSQMAEVNALRNQNAVQFMNKAGGDAFMIEAKPGASSGQKFIVMTDKAVEARVTISSIPKGQEAIIAQMEASGVSRASMGSRMFGYGRMALRFAGEGLLIEGVIQAMKYKGEATQHYVERKSLNGHSPFYNWMMDTYSDVGLYYWYKYSK